MLQREECGREEIGLWLGKEEMAMSHGRSELNAK
jgi:hypothetical protein